MEKDAVGVGGGGLYGTVCILFSMTGIWYLNRFTWGTAYVNRIRPLVVTMFNLKRNYCNEDWANNTFVTKYIIYLTIQKEDNIHKLLHYLYMPVSLYLLGNILHLLD